MVEVPGVMPVIRPVVRSTLVLPLLLTQVPPVTVLESEAVVPAQIPVAPLIVPALGEVLAVTTWVAAITPQLLVLE
jgi:hypothetical protein